MVKKAQQGPVNYEVLNRQFYESREIALAFDPNINITSQSVKGKSLNELNSYEQIGLTVASGAVAYVPVIGPFLSFAVEQWGDDLLNEYKSNPPTEFDPNSMAQQMAKLQYKVASLEMSMEKNNNEFYLAIKKLSQQSKDTKQYLLFKAMAELSSAPNTSANAGCKLTNEDFIAKYYEALGMVGFGTDCAGDVPEVSFMDVAKNLSSYMAINKNTTQQKDYASALEDVSAAKVPLGYQGDFSTVGKVSGASDSMLIQVLDSMYTQLENDVPQQGKAGSNYVERINQYNQSLMFILQSAYNSLQGAYSIEQTNNYLNFLAAVNAYQNKVTNFTQIDSYEGNSAITFKVATSTAPTDYNSLLDDYVNKQNNLQMLFAVRANIMFNTVMQYIVSDKPLTSLSLPALPTQYNVNGKTYSYEVALPDYSKMYPTPHRTSELSRLPAGNWKESSVLYSWNGYSNYYVCNGVNGSNSDKNCALNPPAESGFYDGDKLSVKILAPATANLPASSQTISTDWYVASRSMPFKLSNCKAPNVDSININWTNGSLECSAYKQWIPTISKKTGVEALYYDHSRSSPSSSIVNMSQATNSYDGVPILSLAKTLGGEGDWLTTDIWASENSYENGNEGAFKSNAYVFPRNTSLSEGYVGLVSSRQYDANFMFLTFVDADNFVDGGDMQFSMSCANSVDSSSDIIRYTENNMIQPGYVSCRTLSRTNDGAIVSKYSDPSYWSGDIGYNYKYAPAIVEYKGGNYFSLYASQIRMECSWSTCPFSAVGVIKKDISCSEYSQYCKAD
ncbi:MAG: hypothetical protein EKK54_12065 [Neisseriaceae bacterium]|nr:MAG: hypothetical protein EKK54_12065 [Neisseriaceae bacterium]